jgi:hypothetical protein
MFFPVLESVRLSQWIWDNIRRFGRSRTGSPFLISAPPSDFRSTIAIDNRKEWMVLILSRGHLHMHYAYTLWSDGTGK